MAVQKGKYLNIINCELISDAMPPSIVSSDQCVHVKSCDATLLGAPPSTSMYSMRKKKIELERASKSLQLNKSHGNKSLLVIGNKKLQIAV